MSKGITWLAETVQFSWELVGLIRERAQKVIEKVLLVLELATSALAASWRRLLDGMNRRGPSGAAAAGERWRRGPDVSARSLAGGGGPALHAPQVADPGRGLAAACARGDEAGPGPDYLRARGDGGAEDAREVSRQKADVVPAGGARPRGRGAVPADILRVPPGDVEGTSFDEQLGEPEPGVPPPDEDAGLLIHGRRNPRTTQRRCCSKEIQRQLALS